MIYIKSGSSHPAPFISLDYLFPLQKHVDVFKFKKNIQKCINANIEKEVKEKAQTFEAKPFLALNKEVGATGTSS